MDIKINAKITGKDLTHKIDFHGETQKDKEAVERIKELENLLYDVACVLQEIHKETSNRSEASAKDINEALGKLRYTLLWNFAEAEDVDTLKEIIREYT